MRTAEESYPLLAETANWSGHISSKNNQAIAEANAALREINEARFPQRTVGAAVVEGSRYRMCGPLSHTMPTWLEVSSVSVELMIIGEVQESDGSIVGFTHLHVSDLVAAVGQGWLVADGGAGDV